MSSAKKKGVEGGPGRSWISDAAYKRALEKVRKMTLKQRRKSLVKAGILTPTGKIAKAYRSSNGTETESR